VLPLIYYRLVHNTLKDEESKKNEKVWDFLINIGYNN
jgi:hypothetical protein